MLSNVYYKPVSFKASHIVNSVVSEIGENNFPCNDVLSLFKNYGKNESDLAKIHNEYYENLKYCTNLDEAKIIYPEFDGVTKATELSTADFAELHQIKDTKNTEPVRIKDLSLKLIQRYYSYLDGVKEDSDKYFGYDAASTQKLMKKLNIPVMNDIYFDIVTQHSSSSK